MGVKDAILPSQLNYFIYLSLGRTKRRSCYLELVPKAVARGVTIPQRKGYGFLLVKTK